VRPFGLKPRRRIRIQLLVIVELELIPIAGGGRQPAAEIAVTLVRETETFLPKVRRLSAGGDEME